MDTIEIKASSVEAAISEGASKLGVSEDALNIEIISKGGFLKKAIVRLSLKSVSAEETPTVATEEKSDLAGDVKEEYSAVKDGELSPNDSECVAFVKELLTKMGLNCSLKVTSDNEKLVILISGEDTNYAIGYRGEALDSIQYITLLVANKNVRFKKKLIIDAEGYRERRAATLTSLSKKLAAKVMKSGKALELEPMNPFERRVIHTALQDNPNVTTLSEGEEPNRFVVIIPKLPEKKDDYNAESRNAFKKSGFGKTRSFGQKQRRF